MNRKFLFCLVLLCFPDLSFCSDNYKPGDELYVWAESGLRLRSEHNTKSEIITTLGFGTKVKIIEKTNVKYNFDLIKGSENNFQGVKVDPIILYGHWVKVTVDSNLVGYVIDQYLLAIIPNQPTDGNEWVLNQISIDTVFKSPIPQDGSNVNLTVKRNYRYNITALEHSGGNWAGGEYTFTGYTLEEALIIFCKSAEHFNDYTVEMNLENEILISDGGMCEVTIKRKNDQVTFLILCSC